MGEVTTRSQAGSSRDKKKKTGLKNKPPIETKERNIWRGRREVKIHSRNKRRRRRRGNFKTSEGTQFDCACVRTHISIFDVCYCTYTYIHTYIYILSDSV